MNKYTLHINFVCVYYPGMNAKYIWQAIIRKEGEEEFSSIAWMGEHKDKVLLVNKAEELLKTFNQGYTEV